MLQSPTSVRDRLRRRHPDLLRIYRLVRYELDLARVRMTAALSPRQSRARRRIGRQRDLKVQLGCGPHPKSGWINLDGHSRADLKADLRNRLPLATESAAIIFSEHFLDHVQFPDSIRQILGECHRILQPGGRMRAVVHDGEKLLRSYAEGDREFFTKMAELGCFGDHASTPMEFVNQTFRGSGFHQFIYDFETLQREFRRAGFRQVERSTFLGSPIAELNLDLQQEDRPFQSLYVEAVK